jgi:hypothetical protein
MILGRLPRNFFRMSPPNFCMQSSTIRQSSPISSFLAVKACNPTSFSKAEATFFSLYATIYSIYSHLPSTTRLPVVIPRGTQKLDLIGFKPGKEENRRTSTLRMSTTSRGKTFKCINNCYIPFMKVTKEGPPPPFFITYSGRWEYCATCWHWLTLLHTSGYLICDPDVLRQRTCLSFRTACG